MGRIEDNLAAVHERMRHAAERTGRGPEAVRLMVVTKTQSVERIEEAYRAGARLFGENRIGEAAEKYTGFHEDAELHMIGHLQRNKVNRAVGLVRCVQSIDKSDTAAAIESRCAALDATMDLLLEVNTSGEGSKSGFRDEGELLHALEAIQGMGHLRPRGLMTIATMTDDAAEVRRCFRRLARLREEIVRRFELRSFDELSMGMTSDFEIAIEEGATLVRVGTAIFGHRGAA